MVSKWALKLIRQKKGEEVTLSGMMEAKMPYAPAIAIGTLFSFFAR
jgi:hypothetical protein